MRLSPATFWSMSLVEWRATLRGRVPRRAAPLARADLERLMQTYPD
jgi:uncharacterized phage protein (TIGR02216 family)